MKLSEIKGKDAIKTLAALMEPMARITGNEAVQKAVQGRLPKLAIVQTMMENCPDEVIEIIARLDCADPATYEVNLLTLPMKLYEIINDPEVAQLFFSSDQTEE